jgi:type I restriction enzyme S subunit
MNTAPAMAAMPVSTIGFARTALQHPGAIKIGPFGSQLRKEEMKTEGIKVYGQENIILPDWRAGERRIRKSKFAALSSCELKAGDVVLTMMGTIGRCGVFPANAEPGIMDSHLLRIQPDPSLIDRKFLAMVLGDERLVGRQLDRLSHGSIMAGLSSAIVRRLEVPVPPLSEQRSIAEILDTLDEAIRKTEQVIAKLQQMKQGLLHDLLTRGIDANGELRDPERHPEQFKDSPLGWIPRGWEVAAFLTQCRSSAFGPRFSSDLYADDGASPPFALQTWMMKETSISPLCPKRASPPVR